MDDYRRLVNSIFEDRVVNIGRVLVVLIFTAYLVSKDPERSKDYWSAFYDMTMTLPNVIRR